MDWSSLLTVLAHEVRAPAQVISGYARMLTEGRLDDEERLRALTQIQSAASRIGLITQQASDVARWLKPIKGTGHGFCLRSLADRAMRRVAMPDRIAVRLTADDEAICVRTLDDDALAGAVAAIIDAVSREVIDDTVLVVARASSSPNGCELLVGASALLQSPRETPGLDGGTSLSLERGGLGLAFVLAGAVFEAHEATLWNVGGQTGIVGVRLRVEPSGRA